MNLTINAITKEPEIIDNIPSIWGEITINEFKETFVIPLENWNIEDCKKQWQEGLERILKKDTSCLVTAVQDPQKAPFINWWLLYRFNDLVIIRNQIIFGKIYKDKINDNAFTVKNCYDFIHPYKKKKVISEWKIQL